MLTSALDKLQTMRFTCTLLLHLHRDPSEAQELLLYPFYGSGKWGPETMGLTQGCAISRQQCWDLKPHNARPCVLEHTLITKPRQI